MEVETGDFRARCVYTQYKYMERRNINANTCRLEFYFCNLCCFTVGLQVLLHVSYLTLFQCMKNFVITILTTKICILQCYYNLFMTI